MTRVLIVPGATFSPSKVTLNGASNWEELFSPGDFPSLSLSRSGLTATRKFKVPVDEIEAFALECFPDSGPIGQHPGLPQLFVDDLEIGPFGGGGSVDMYQHSNGYVEPAYWDATVKYAPYVAEQETTAGDADLYDGDINVGTEVMLIDGAGYTWAGEANRITERTQIPITIPIQDRTVNIPNLSVIPYGAINANAGKVNAGNYLGFPAQTVLYLGASIKWQFTFRAKRKFSVNHKFKIKCFQSVSDGIIGWNHFFRKSDSRWRRTNPLVYVPGSFTGLLAGVQ